MLLIFDLDDTLYEEITFVKSGFKAVAKYLAKKYNLETDELFNNCLKILNKEGRVQVFNILLKEYKLYSKNEVLNCIKIYRYHKPDIKLYDDALRFLNKNSKSNIYVVTDGNKIVQRNKIMALNLDNFVKRAYPTRQFGIKYEKPSPHVFLKIANLEKLCPSQIIYFGDNPYKDFCGIKPIGFKTIRIKRGQFSEIVLDKEHEAHLTFNNFDEININSLNKLINA